MFTISYFYWIYDIILSMIIYGKMHFWLSLSHRQLVIFKRKLWVMLLDSFLEISWNKSLAHFFVSFLIVLNCCIHFYTFSSFQNFVSRPRTSPQFFNNFKTVFRNFSNDLLYPTIKFPGQIYWGSRDIKNVCYQIC